MSNILSRTAAYIRSVLRRVTFRSKHPLSPTPRSRTPQGNIDDDWIQTKQGEYKRKYVNEFRRDRNAAGIFVISFPKSGRTWLRAMVGCYLARLADRPLSDALKLEELCDQAACKRIVFSHGGANFVDWLPPASPLVATPSLWSGRPVILLVRDPRDVLVSAYHHAKFRTGEFDGSLSEFIREPRTGIEKVLTAYNRWYENRHLATSFDIISYESLHSTPKNGAALILRRAGIPEVDETILAECIGFSTFDNLQKSEERNFFNDKSLTSAWGADQRARKVRQGKIGGFKDFLSDEDLDFIQFQTEKLGNPFYRIDA